MFHFDPLYFAFLIPGMALSFWASWKVKSTFREYSEIPSRNGYSGVEAARELLKRKGITNVTVEETQGFLSDHYDPFHRVLRLSPDVYRGRSLASLGVAAHEAGHAIQHATGYGPLKFRSLVVKPAAIGSNLGGVLCAAGLAMQSTGMVWLGVIAFSIFVLFTVVTLPVEFNASRRAVVALTETGIISQDEAGPTWQVLRAAALTYLAAAITAILQLIYFLIRSGILGGRRDD